MDNTDNKGDVDRLDDSQQALGGTDELPADSGPEDEGGDAQNDPVVLAKRLRDTQAAFHQARQELAELKKKLEQVDELRGSVDAIIKMKDQTAAAPEEKGEDPLSFLYDNRITEDLLTDPDKMVGTLRRVSDVFARAIVGLQRDLTQRVEEIKSAIEEQRVVSTADQKVISLVNELSKDSELAGLPRVRLIKIAQKILSNVGKSEETEGRTRVPEYPGSPPRGGTVKGADMDGTDELVRRIWGK